MTRFLQFVLEAAFGSSQAQGDVGHTHKGHKDPFAFVTFRVLLDKHFGQLLGVPYGCGGGGMPGTLFAATPPAFAALF